MGALRNYGTKNLFDQAGCYKRIFLNRTQAQTKVKGSNLYLTKVGHDDVRTLIINAVLRLSSAA